MIAIFFIVTIKEYCGVNAHCKNDCWLKAIENVKFKGEEMEEQFECIKDFYMNRSKEKAFTKGKIYKVIMHGIDSVDFINNKNVEHTVTKGFLEQYFRKVDKKKTYKDWEILKMIREGQLKDGDRYKGINEDKIYVVGSHCSPNFFGFEREFELIEKEYMTFDEARKSDKRFKHKDMKDYNYNIWKVLEQFEGYSAADIDRMLDEKAWEVQK